MRACTITKFGSYSRWSFYNTHPNRSRSVTVSRSREQKPHSTVSRALRMVEQIFYSNSFSYFVTLTFSERSVGDRQSYEVVKHRLSDVLNEFSRKYAISYLLVPDFHDDGAVHFHGFMNVPFDVLTKAGHFRLFKAGARSIKYYSKFLNKRLGRNDFRPLYKAFGRASVAYVLKYVTKAAKLAREGSQLPLYIRSRGLASFTSVERFSGDEAVFFENFLPCKTTCIRRYDYDVVQFPYVSDDVYNDVFRAFYNEFFVRVALPSKIALKNISFFDTDFSVTRLTS